MKTQKYFTEILEQFLESINLLKHQNTRTIFTFMCRYKHFSKNFCNFRWRPLMFLSKTKKILDFQFVVDFGKRKIFT